MRGLNGSPRLRRSLPLVVIAAAATVVAFTSHPAAPPTQEVDWDQVLQGRQLVLEHGCGGCHGGFANPAAEDWLAGLTSPAQEFVIGPCAMEPGATPCFRTRPRNLTPDNTTGMGRFSERQVFNALRYGLRPGETADVEITSTTPGEGNFPMFPKYLAPPMPWNAWRHMADEDLWAIAAYLKHGVKRCRIVWTTARVRRTSGKVTTRTKSSERIRPRRSRRRGSRRRRTDRWIRTG